LGNNRLMGGTTEEIMPGEAVMTEQKTTQTEEAQTENEQTILGNAKSETTGSGSDAPASQTPAATEEEPSDKETVPAAADAVELADFNVPDGIVLNAAAVASFKAVAKELKLTQENAQKLVDLNIALQQSAEKQMESDFKAMSDSWADETKKKYGANFDKEMSYVAKARDMFGSAELTKLTAETKIGNHPAFIDFLNKVGKSISEGNMVEGNGKQGLANLTPQQVLERHTSG
jgi:hypothetical protein